MGKKGGCDCIYSPDLTEAGTIGKPPQLILINRGGWLRATALVNPLTEAITLRRSSWLISIN